MSELTCYCGKNQASVLDNAEFVSERIAELVSSGCVQELVEVPYICSPLSVVENDAGKKD